MRIDLQPRLKSIALILALAFSLPDSFANIYIWTDENGKKHFSDRQPDQDFDVKEKKLPQRKPPQVASKNEQQKGSVNKSTTCVKQLRSCESQQEEDYSYRLYLCKGDWSATAAAGNALYGGKRTGESMARDCKFEAANNHDDRLKACSATYQMCLKD